MATITIQVEWRVPHGWSYRVYEFSDILDGMKTAAPSETGGLSKLVPGLTDNDPNATLTHKAAIESAVATRFPDATIQFGKLPVNH